MAHIYPEHLPESILNDPKRAAERKVYEALVKLGNQFTVFYSVAWQARTSGSGIRDGEADFVIAHPQLGILVMEVKGGGVAYDATTYEWYSIDRSGEKHRIKDPVEQARTSRYTLFEKLSDLPGWDKKRRLTIGHVVAFPDIHAKEVLRRPDLPLEIVFDAKAMQDIDSAVRKAFSYYTLVDQHIGALGYDRLEMMEALLAKSIQIRTPLGVELDQEDERLIELTEQ